MPCATHAAASLVGLVILVAAMAALAWWAVTRRPAIPKRTLLIGYQHNPPSPVHRPGQPPTGLSVETVTEAARRAGIPLNWKEVPAGPDSALASGVVDLWPLITDLPERRRTLHVRAPWMQAQHALVLRDGREVPGGDFAGSIAITAIPVHVKMVREPLSGGPNRGVPGGQGDALVKLCTGEVTAAFLESRLALAVLREAAAGVRGRRPPRAHAPGRLPARGRREASSLRAPRIGSVTRSRAWRTTARSPCCSPDTPSSASTTRGPPTTCWRRRSATGACCG